jgi:hypothetical protein
MSLAIGLIGGWVLATGVVGVFAWSLGRAAAIGDRQDYGLVETGAAVSDRRVGQPDRRDEARPWLAGSPGRRGEDVLRRDVGAADLALAEEEALAVRAEARRARRAG